MDNINIVSILSAEGSSKTVSRVMDRLTLKYQQADPSKKKLLSLFIQTSNLDPLWDTKQSRFNNNLPVPDRIEQAAYDDDLKNQGVLELITISFLQAINPLIKEFDVVKRFETVRSLDPEIDAEDCPAHLLTPYREICYSPFGKTEFLAVNTDSLLEGLHHILKTSDSKTLPASMEIVGMEILEGQLNSESFYNIGLDFLKQLAQTPDAFRPQN